MVAQFTQKCVIINQCDDCYSYEIWNTRRLHTLKKLSQCKIKNSV